MMAGSEQHYTLPRAEFDAPVKVLIAVAPYYKDIADDLLAGARAEIETTVRRINKIETAIEPMFQEHFVAANAIPHKTATFPELARVTTLPSPNFNVGSGGGEQGGRRRRRRG